MINKLSAIEDLVERFESKTLSRRQLIASMVALAGGAASTPSSAQETLPAILGRSMNHVSLSVADVERSAEFYKQVLGMEVISRPGNGGLNLGLGDESFLGLYKLNNPGGMHHMCIGVDNYDPDALAQTLLQHGISATINRDPANRTSGGDQLYFTDPDGISVQLAQHGYLG